MKNEIKLLWICFASLVVYKFGLNNYNFYYDQPFLTERLIIIVLFVLSLFRLAFIIPFSVLFFLTLSQYFYPLGGYSITDLYPLINFFPLLITYLVLSCFIKISEVNFWRSLFIFHISYYFIPGVAKIEISPNLYEWILHNDLSNLFISSLEMGWLPRLDTSIIDLITKTLTYFKIPLNVIVILIEIASIFLLGRAKTFRLYLAIASLFHLVIFVSSGIFFWKWIVINIGIIGISFFDRKKSFEKIFDLKPAYFAVLTLITPLFLRPLSLAWFDTKIVEKYEIYLKDNSGNDILVTGNFFKPYDKIFSQNRFFYLNKKNTVVGTYGSIGKDHLFYSDFNPIDFFKKNVNSKKTDFNNHILIEKNRIDELKGGNSHDTIKVNNFKKFLRTYLRNYNDKKGKSLSLTIPHIHQPNNSFPNKVKGYKVVYKKIYHDPTGLKKITFKELINESL